ncbi:hypothetical protein MRX96_044341 [Rhipicephalus microplus]
MRFSTTSAEENFHLPGLAFADDLVVMAESNQELQSLLDICQTELASLGLRFNTKKSAVVRLTGGSTDAAALTLGGELLATRNDYRYLGVTLLDEDGSSDNGGGRYAVAATKRRLTEWWATIRRT